MNVNKRQKLVDRFNDPEGKEFVFLLSSKAGGCGINLIGANRLVLFDPAWNPCVRRRSLSMVTDFVVARAINRLWREYGAMVKRRLVSALESSLVHDADYDAGFVYRFQATGTIEEKIFQRQ